MGHRNGPLGYRAGKRRSRLLMLLVVVTGSMGVTACALHSAVKVGEVKVDPVLDPDAWYSQSVGTRHLPGPASADVTISDPAPASVASVSHELRKPQRSERPPPFVVTLSDNPPVEEAIYADPRPPALDSPAALDAFVPAPGAAGKQTGFIQGEREVAVTHASSVIAWLRSMDSRSSFVLLLIAFFIGLVLGSLLSIAWFLSRRSKAHASDARPQLDTDVLIEAMRAHPHTLREESRTPDSEQESEPVLARAADLPHAANRPEPLPVTPSTREDRITIWTIAAPQALSPAPIIKTAFAPPARVVASSDAQTDGDDLPSVEVLGHAETLLKQGQLEQALTRIQAHLKGLQPFVSGAVRQIKPAAFSLARLHADIRWKMAIEEEGRQAFAEAAAALEDLLALKPADTAALLRLAHCLLHQVDDEPDEMEKRILLQSCIDMLKAIDVVDKTPGLLRLGMLGEALCRRVLLDVVIDEVLLAEAESILRQALAQGATDDSGVAWCLQKLLGTDVPTLAPAIAQARLQECTAILRLGLKTHDKPTAGAPWRAALLRAELEEIRRARFNPASRRLRLRDLYARYVAAMQEEEQAEVLAAWIDLLCAMVTPMVGSAALERYREIDSVLQQLLQADQQGRLYATAWMQVMHCRLNIAGEAGRRDLLQRAAAILEPRMHDADDALRLQAGKLALEQALIATEPEAKNEAYTRALALARPLTAVPSLAAPALGCVLQALLAMGENEERRVYATCLDAIATDDAGSLALLAECFHRDGKFANACRYFEAAWSKRDKAMPEAWLDLWREALGHWSRQAGNDEACQRNQRHLRQADTRRFRPRAA
jgi:hypothetical protein